MKKLLFIFIFIFISTSCFSAELDHYKRELLVDFVQDVAAEFNLDLSDKEVYFTGDIYEDIGFPVLYDYTYFIENDLLAEASLYKEFIIRMFPEWETLTYEIARNNYISNSLRQKDLNGHSGLDVQRIPRDVPAGWDVVFFRALDDCFNACHDRNSARNMLFGASYGAIVGGFAGALAGAASFDLADCVGRCSKASVGSLLRSRSNLRRNSHTSADGASYIEP